MLTQRKRDFIRHYQITRNASESARLCGYSVKSARNAGYRLMKDEDVIKELEAIEAKKIAKYEEQKEQLSRESFVETAWKAYLSEEEPTVKPRYLEIVGKALGYLAPKESAGSTTTNNTLVLNLDNDKLTADERWAKLRNLLTDEG